MLWPVEIVDYFLSRRSIKKEKKNGVIDIILYDIQSRDLTQYWMKMIQTIFRFIIYIYIYIYK